MRPKTLAAALVLATAAFCSFSAEVGMSANGLQFNGFTLGRLANISPLSPIFSPAC